MEYRINRRQVKAIQMARSRAIEQHNVPPNAIRISLLGDKVTVDDQYAERFRNACRETKAMLDELNEAEQEEAQA